MCYIYVYMQPAQYPPLTLSIIVIVIIVLRSVSYTSRTTGATVTSIIQVTSATDIFHRSSARSRTLCDRTSTEAGRCLICECACWSLSSVAFGIASAILATVGYW